MIKKRVIAIIIVIALVLFPCAVWYKFLHTPLVKVDQGFKYRVAPGASIKSIIDNLYFNNIIQHPLLFKLLIRLRGDDRIIKAGEYLFPKGTTPSSMITQMINGSGMIYYAFTIVPGENFRQLRHALSKTEDLQHSVANLSDAEIMKRLGHPELKPEGQFYPDTYYFAGGSADLLLLKRAFNMMQTKLMKVWLHRAPNLPFKNPNDILIAASLIEKETDLDMERPIIAGVIVNRLRKNMLLQIDPTVIYGLGSRFDGTIYRENLLEKNPYNTYVNKGLPPTPITIPSIDSIKAAANPQNHDYLYFVARGRGDDSHQFSKTLAEHYAAVAAAKKPRPFLFNTSIIRYYLLKIFSRQIFDTM